MEGDAPDDDDAAEEGGVADEDEPDDDDAAEEDGAADEDAPDDGSAADDDAPDDDGAADDDAPDDDSAPEVMPLAPLLVGGELPHAARPTPMASTSAALMTAMRLVIRTPPRTVRPGRAAAHG